MRAPAIRPRPDQISELTRGISLPLPEIHDDLLEIIAEGLHGAYHDILVSAPQTVSAGDEAEVTALMEARLNNMIGEETSLWNGLACSVARGKESVSYDGSHLENRPDLSIKLTSRTGNFPLKVEVKLIDATTSKTVGLYYRQGIRRFIEGEYAWAAREAFMMAYVRDGSSIASKLTPYLLKMNKKGSSSIPSPLGNNVMDLARSMHGRSFTYTHQAPPLDQPGPIVLWHLWLS